MLDYTTYLLPVVFKEFHSKCFQKYKEIGESLKLSDVSENYTVRQMLVKLHLITFYENLFLNYPVIAEGQMERVSFSLSSFVAAPTKLRNYCILGYHSNAF